MTVFTSSFRDVLRKSVSGQTLSSEEEKEAFEMIMKGEVSDVEIASFLTALHMRGETAQDVIAAVHVVRRHMVPVENVPPHTIDVCGTGGDGLGTLNVSTATAFVLAGLGVPVAKHGGRALSSKAGATDVLEALGIPADGNSERQARRIRDDHVAFLAAPYHHPLMKEVGAVRKKLGFRTLFNLLGPLCNPAKVRRQLVGVFHQKWCRPVAEVLGQLGGESLCIVHGKTDEGGIDELTLAGSTLCTLWEKGSLSSHEITPDMAGLPFYPISDLRGADALSNARRMEALFSGEKGCYRDTVLLNAALALHVSGRGNVLEKGQISSSALRHNITIATRSLENGLALEALHRARRSVSPHKEQ